ncbi:BQ5605_C028g10474 [Microbotryum silenes-dioicae]|uniref:BQ5605_C028g10474 protein n=1 Tax=Microbotryum silenes-dioicae TaxID=796604 RepID=A0A2X0N4M4_9BASI|nr:BQ5605_C028g10474 [Microbotryum silenes-dioicae]
MSGDQSIIDTSVDADPSTHSQASRFPAFAILKNTNLNWQLSFPKQYPSAKCKDDDEFDRAHDAVHKAMHQTCSESVAHLLVRCYDMTPEQTVEYLRKHLGRSSLRGIITQFGKLFSVGPPPAQEDDYLPWAGFITRLTTDLRAHDLTFDKVVACHLIAIVGARRPSYLDQFDSKGVDAIPTVDTVIAAGRAPANLRQDIGNAATALLATTGAQSKPPGPCWNCGEDTHFNKNCSKPKKKKSSRRKTTKGEEPMANLALRSVEDILGIDFVGAFFTQLPKKHSREMILYDTAATHHVINDPAAFADLKATAPSSLKGINGEGKTIMGVGTACVEDKNGKRYNLVNSIFVPSAPANLFAGHRADRDSRKITIQNGRFTVVGNGDILLTGQKLNSGLYRLDLKLVRAQSAPLDCLNMKSRSDLKCELCLASKATHKPFLNSESRAGKPLDLVHIDLLSFDGELSLANHRYALVIVDDCTRYMWVLTMPQKSDSFERFKTWKLRVELSSGHTLKVVRSDRGGEFLSTEFKQWLDDTGLSRQLTIPSTPEQNGVAKRANRSISEAARTMLYESGLPTVFWAEAVATYVYVKNRSPHSALGGKVPFREWTGKPAYVHHLRVFGC